MEPGTLRVRLRDGSSALVREVGPADRPALLRGFAALSRESRVFRFLHHVEQLGEAEAERYSSPDRCLHVAIGATVIEAHEEIPAGIAHFFRPTLDARRAELALTVVDRFQGRRLGIMLLGRLMRIGAEQGLRQLDALVHVRNDGMIHILRGLGASERLEEGIRIFALPLHRYPGDYPDGSVGDGVRVAYALEPVQSAG
jgi:RimJ/RimL family protein N-acetyltransferase